MNSLEIQKIINETNYIDARVTKLNCDYFADEVTISFEDDDAEKILLFCECYKVHFNHTEQYKKQKPLKFCGIPQISYFIQDIEVNEVDELYEIKINMHPMDIEIKCKSITVL